jgi:hypothetical protein
MCDSRFKSFILRSLMNQQAKSAAVRVCFSLFLAGLLCTWSWHVLGDNTNCVPVPTGLVSWWPAEGTAIDIISGNNGSLLNGAAFAPGKVGQAFSFNGINQQVQVPDAPSLDPTNAITVETWVYLRTLPPVNAVTVVGKDDGGAARQLQLGIGDLGSGFIFRSLLGVVGQVVVLNGTTVLQAGTWYHAAMTYDGSILRLYVNGVLDATMSLSGAIVPTSQPLQIGGLVGGPWFINGLVDEVSLYDRALLVSEIQAIYSAGGGGKCAVPIAPSLSSQPANQTATLGSSVVFSVAAGGSPPLSYQWEYMGNDIIGATNSSLTLTNVQFGQQGPYNVVVTNVAGSVTSNAVLTVVFPPATIRVVNVTNAASGGSVTVPVVLSANGNENGVGFSRRL